MSSLARPRMVFAAVATAALLSAAAGKEPPRVPLAALPPPPRPAAALHVELERLQASKGMADTEASAGGAFDATTWRIAPPPPPPPPPPAAVKAVPPPPSAPPLPFAYLGLYEEGGRRVVLLTRGDRLYTVGEGEVIDQTWRVERLEGGLLELTYLPLSIKQTLTTGTSG